ncbi:cytochrome c-type biogenesis protein CcmH [Paracoccus sp. M683]|uniref:cytochrome c-type biogenesis protein n=1 Tax=Paracoccus sp. M683 TaxID=2594268 RepID=UPI00117FF606|nr:cytochrome c-type biogenesis protein [Paracoccus sp. M683]TRW95188.1 cytochrome c-type biogenesis protein CcmH [Paracoccus sp. M683]
MRRLVATILLLVLMPVMALAVQPDEVLDDPALESRAREISQKLRCPVCQGENIDESNAPISRDLRLYVRERLEAGDDDAQVIQAVTDRFGEFVLFQPPARGANLVLWLAGPVMALLALLVGWTFLRSRQRAEPDLAEPLDDKERARLDQIMKDGP